jgi:hypothetical protein
VLHIGGELYVPRMHDDAASDDANDTPSHPLAITPVVGNHATNAISPPPPRYARAHARSHAMHARTRCTPAHARSRAIARALASLRRRTAGAGTAS